MSVVQEIRQFSGDYRFLSNFWVEPDGTCVEVEYQRAKCRDVIDRELFNGKTPYQAKSIGRTLRDECRIREDWFDVNVDIMWFYVAKKFADHETLWDQLILTRSLPLIEGNNHHDLFWGVCEGHCRRDGVFVHPPRGANGLGELLMLVRNMDVPDSLQSRYDGMIPF